MILKKNIGPKDRLKRFAFAVVLLLFAVYAKSWIALILSLFTFFEAAFSWCIYYKLTGRNTCPIDLQQPKK